MRPDHDMHIIFRIDAKFNSRIKFIVGCCFGFIDR